jgi:D-alanyl-D-alanine carboxypeptidase
MPSAPPAIGAAVDCLAQEDPLGSWGNGAPVQIVYRRIELVAVVVSAAMLASCSGSGDRPADAELGDTGSSVSDDLASDVVTVPSTVSPFGSFSTVAGTDSPDRSIDEALAAVSAQAEELAENDQFSGAMLVARNGQILFEDAWGFADRDAGTPNTVDTKFRIASMNKMFTGVATLELVESGQVVLDDPIGTYLTDYPNEELASTVTVRHLLTHTGGTGDFLDETYLQHRLELREHSDYIALYGERPVRFEPGSRYEYSNYGFILLGALIEAVTGESYYDYVRQHVFAPAGMTATDSLPESDEVPGRAVGYTKSQDSSDHSWVSNVDLLPWRGTAAGGGYSTVGDLELFADALTSGKLLSDRMLAEATHEQSDSYGFGFAVQEEPVHVFGHGGAFPGMNGELLIYPELDYVIVALSNLDEPAAGALLNFVIAQMPGLNP